MWGDYDRDLFAHWSDEDGDGCDTRQEVLIRDSSTTPVLHPERVCRVVEGRWWSAYDDWWTTDPADLHIDHLVPLAEAWKSGARLWTDAEREAFANDTAGLVAVSAASNLAKGASDPTDWPPRQRGRVVHLRRRVDRSQSGMEPDRRPSRARRPDCPRRPLQPGVTSVTRQPSVR